MIYDLMIYNLMIYDLMIYNLMIYDLMIYDLMIYMKTRRQGCWGSVFKHLSTHEIAIEHVETPRGELSAESIDNRLCDEVVQHSACASLGTKAKQKTLSAKVGAKKNRTKPITKLIPL